MKEASWKATDCFTMLFHNAFITSNDFNDRKNNIYTSYMGANIKVLHRLIKRVRVFLTLSWYLYASFY